MSCFNSNNNMKLNKSCEALEVEVNRFEARLETQDKEVCALKQALADMKQEYTARVTHEYKEDLQ
jgi:chaperonin cofactor prefoldin